MSQPLWYDPWAPALWLAPPLARPRPRPQSFCPQVTVDDHDIMTGWCVLKPSEEFYLINQPSVNSGENNKKTRESNCL